MISHEPRLRAVDAATDRVRPLALSLIALALRCRGLRPRPGPVRDRPEPGAPAGLLDRHQRDALSGRRDARSRAGPAGAEPAYFVFPLLKNNLPASTGGPDPNQIEVNSFAVDIGESKFGSLPAGVKALFDTLEHGAAARPNTPCCTTARRGRLSISSGGGTAAARVAGFPIDLAARVAATGAVGISRTSMLVNIKVRAFGKTQHAETSNRIRWITRSYVCNGCLVAQRLHLPVRVRAREHGQSLQHRARQLRGLLQPERRAHLPADGEHGAVRRGARRGSRVPVRRARVHQCVQHEPAPAADRATAASAPVSAAAAIRRRPSGDVVDRDPGADGRAGRARPGIAGRRPRARLRRQDGTDFIDATSVEAVVTKAATRPSSNRRSSRRSGTDIFSGRISLGDRPTRRLHADGERDQLGRHQRRVGARRLPDRRRTDPARHVAEAAARLQGAARHRGRRRSGTHSAARRSPRQGRQLRRRARRRSAIPPTTSIAACIDLRDPMPPMILPPLVNEQLLTVWATNVNGKRTEQHLVFFIDEEGPVDHADDARRPARSSATSWSISARVLDPSGVLDSSVIAVIGDDTRPALFSIQLKPDGAGVYSSFFDTRKLTGCNDPPKRSDLCIVYPTISFRASDELGNERAIGYELRGRQHRAGGRPGSAAHSIVPAGGAASVCSLGIRSARPRTASSATCPTTAPSCAQVFDLRARIQDDGNHAVGLKLVPISAVDPDKTSVYVLDDETKPLIVDTDGDGGAIRSTRCSSRPPSRPPTTTRC